MIASRDAVVLENVEKRFGGRRGHQGVAAIDDVSLVIPLGGSLGLVGESGSGKSTLARCILGLIQPDDGRIEVLGRSICDARPRELRAWRKDMQIVFQEPYESLDPRMRVGAAVGEPLLLHTTLRGAALRRRVSELLKTVSLTDEVLERFPDQLSGGQQQRVNIARALATEPKVLVLDEPTSSLDVSVRAEILGLLVQLQQRLGLTYLLISHDLRSVRLACDQVAVMYLGRVVEVGATEAVLTSPRHPYSRLLLDSEIPLDPSVKFKMPPVVELEGVIADPVGCTFAPRCSRRIDRCVVERPLLEARGDGSAVACFRPISANDGEKPQAES